MALLDRDSIAVREQARLSALIDLNILDTAPETEFDELARIAATLVGTASAGVSLIDERRQWFKARRNIDFLESERSLAFCDHAVAQGELIVVPDASSDLRFADNPLVTQDGGIRFYAGAPLRLASGHCIGALCVFDPVARPDLSEAQKTTLMLLADVATALIETRHARRLDRIAAEVVTASADAVVAADAEGRIVYANGAAERLFGRPAEKMIGQVLESLFDGPANPVRRLMDQFRDRAERSSSISSFVKRDDGVSTAVEVTVSPWGTMEERGVAVVARDVSEQRRVEKARADVQGLLDNVVANLPAMLFVKDAQTYDYVLINRAAEAVMGKTAAEVLGSNDRRLFPKIGAAYESRDAEAVLRRVPHVFESSFVRDDGVVARLRTTRVLIDGPDRRDQYILGFSEDVTPTRIAEAKALHLSRHDALTGVVNRFGAAERLERQVQAGARFAMLSVDLRRFKTINEQWGLTAGDQVLTQAADRLRAIVSPSDWIARVGGDEFAVVLIGSEPKTRARDAAERIAASLSAPYATDRGLAHLDVAVAGVIAPDHGETAAELRENVDVALTRAKQSETGAPCFFDETSDVETRMRRRLKSDLRGAIERGDIGLAYQPVVAAETGKITSAEALARWRHPSLGPIRPDVFIGLAEGLGLIEALGSCLLRLACQDASRWPVPIRVAVNLSPAQFLSGRLVETVEAALAVSGLPANRLQLEVTEGLVIRDVESTFDQLTALKALGIQLLMDDFGVGYSSLSYFKRFPFDKVKIDKSFVDDIEQSQASRAVIAAVAGLGRALGMGIVAEGVETHAQRAELVALGCTHLQGYLFSRPLGVEDMMTFITAST